MEQAIAYATFIARLLRSDSGKEWYKIFGFTKDIPAELTIDVAIVMPYDENRKERFETEENEPIIVPIDDNTSLKLYSLYFERNENGDLKEFVGSLKDDMLEFYLRKS
jgi:hypothetical protein